ncbi:MAG TPA: FAD-binding protein [Bacteriovoracaceae bacterium]|nr:FAD-binding protein [Bacteriovoracaceae bacterium]
MNLAGEISAIPELEFHKDRDLTSFTTFRLKSIGDMVEVKSVDALQKLLPILNHHKKEYLVVGWGANQILPPVCDKIILHLSFPFDPTCLESPHDLYNLPASLGINHLTAHAVKFGLKGWEVFTGIPASLGGAIYMNAGTNLGEIGSLIKSVQLVTPTGQMREEKIDSKSFSYRHNHFVKPGEVIVGASLCHNGLEESISVKIKEYLEYRKRTQPLASKNCGCVFKNPHRELQAGRLIDSLGLKGLKMGNLKVSEKHANFMENLGEAKWDQFESIVETIRFHMDHFYGIEFDLEVKIPYH